jgi:ADP-ribose pyrophosphatase
MNEITIQQAFRFCPSCGKQAVSDGVTPPQTNPFCCRHCGFTRFFGPFVAIGALVMDEAKRLLLVRRARSPGKGLLGLPGGFIDANETVEFALARELREETSLELSDAAYLTSQPNCYRHKGINAPVVDLFFVCTVTNPDAIVLQDAELTEYLWQIPDASSLDQLAFQSHRKAIQIWLKSQK